MADNIETKVYASKASGARVISFSTVIDEESPRRVVEPEDQQKSGKGAPPSGSIYATVGTHHATPSLPPPRTFTDIDNTDNWDTPNDKKISTQDRDPQNINEDILVSFPDIFAEPTGLHSDDKVWVCTYKTYNGSKFLCYRICTYICAVPAAFIWGITFACLAFCHIWYVVPFLKAFLIELKCIGKVFMLCVKSFCDPIYTSIGLIYSRIRVNFIRSDGNGGGQYPV